MGSPAHRRAVSIGDHGGVSSTTTPTSGAPRDGDSADAGGRQLPPPPPPRRRGMSGTARNIAYSTLAVLVICFAWWALVPQGSEVQRAEAQIGPSVDFAVSTVDWEVWAPEELPDGWVPEQAAFATLLDVPDNLRLGYRAPDGSFVGMDRAVDVGAEWERVLLGDVEQEGTVSIDGPDGVQDWQVWRAGNAEDDKVALALPSQGGGPTTVVRGDGEVDTLVTFVEALEPQRP